MHFYAFFNFPITEKTAKTMISATTIVAPTGVSKRIERIIPAREQMIAVEAAQIVTLLKLLKILIAERAGKMISAEIRSAPTRFIAITITTAVIIASARL